MESPTLRQKRPPGGTRVIATHPSLWDSLRAARSVPRHRLRAGIRLRRTGLDALASRPSHRSRAVRAPAHLRLAEMGPSFPRAAAVRIPHAPPEKAALRRPFWRRVGDSNPRKTCAFTRFPGVLLKPLGQLSRSWLPLCTGNIEGNTRAARGQERVFEVTRITNEPLTLSQGQESVTFLPCLVQDHGILNL